MVSSPIVMELFNLNCVLDAQSLRLDDGYLDEDAAGDSDPFQARLMSFEVNRNMI